MVKLLKYLKPYIVWIVLLVGLVFLQVWCDLQLPEYMSSIVNNGILMQDQALINTEGVKMIAVVLLSVLCTVIVGYIASRVGAGFASTVREKVFGKVESFSAAEFDHFSTASLITRTTNDIQQVQMVIMLGLRMFISAPLTGIQAVFKAMEKGQGLTWIMLLAVLGVTVLVVVIFVIAIPRFKLIQKKVDRLNLVTRENLSGLRVIRAFNTQAREEEKFAAANTDLMKIQLFINRLMSLMFPFMMIIMNLTAVAILWAGAVMIGDGNLLIGDMMAFIQYTMQVIMSFLMLTMVFIMVPRAAVSGDRIMEVLSSEPSIVDPASPKRSMPSLRGVLEFKDVCFSYPDAKETVLEDISFTARPGETTAFIGSTGSGKSTLINLIPRFFDVTKGKILVDGVDVREYAKDDLCAKIGYVPQKNTLFSGTIESNVKFGAPNATVQQMQKAVEIAQVSDFIAEQENGMQSDIAQGGQNLSGGQKQRLAIARAVVRDPEIYIFDDTFSALDFRTDAALRKALKDVTNQATMLLVAQRISSIVSADQIVVLEKGKMVGIGTHKELLQNCGVYREIALSQLSEEELA